MKNDKIKEYFKRSFKYLIILTSYILFISLFSILGLFNGFTIDILNMLFSIIFFFYIGFRYGKRAIKKGFLKGLMIGSILVVIMFLISIIFISNITLSSLIYYMILISSSTFGSMLGINKKEIK